MRPPFIGVGSILWRCLAKPRRPIGGNLPRGKMNHDKVLQNGRLLHHAVRKSAANSRPTGGTNGAKRPSILPPASEFCSNALWPAKGSRAMGWISAHGDPGLRRACRRVSGATGRDVKEPSEQLPKCRLAICIYVYAVAGEKSSPKSATPLVWVIRREVSRRVAETQRKGKPIVRYGESSIRR
jgi:hypothetical protein